jgi:periplasmic copper chaperone A
VSRQALAGLVLPAMLLVMLPACSRDEPPAFNVAAVTAYAPLPGQSSGVAYFSLENSATMAVTLQHVTSPEFTSVQMHTTLLDAGISRMMPLDSLTIAAFSAIEFAPGGTHLMLMGPHEDLGAGDDVTFEFHYRYEGQDDDRLAVRALLQSR